MDFSTTTSEVGDYSVIGVSGELDVYTAPALEEVLGDLVDAGKIKVVVDLSAVSFMDSTGLGLLIKALKWTRENGGALEVVANSEKILKVFRITGLDGVLTLHESVETATGA